MAEKKISFSATIIKLIVLIFAVIGFLSTISFLDITDSAGEKGIPVNENSDGEKKASEQIELVINEPQKITFTNNFIMSSGYEDSYLRYSKSTYEKHRTNVIIFNSDSLETHLVFDSPMNITDIDFPDISDSSGREYILYKCNTSDTNKDSFINSLDNKVLYISDLNGKKLEKLTDIKRNVERVHKYKKGKMLLIELTKENIERIGDEKIVRKEHFLLTYDTENRKLSETSSFGEAVLKAKKLLNAK